MHRLMTHYDRCVEDVPSIVRLPAISPSKGLNSGLHDLRSHQQEDVHLALEQTHIKGHSIWFGLLGRTRPQLVIDALDTS